jgi:EpsG family
LIYLLVYFLLLLSGWVSRTDASVRRALYGLCLIGLFLFAGFRYRVGCDWTGYLNIYDMARTSLSVRSEVSFWYLNRLLHSLDLEYPFINVIAALVFFAGLHALARRQPDPLGVLILSYPILILELAMSGIRQAMAVGFVCFAWNAFVAARLSRFVLFVLVAASFHTSAMLFLLLAPFVRGEFSIRRAAMAGLLALPGVYFILTSATFATYSSRYIGGASEAAGAPFRCGLLALTGIAFLWFLDRAWKKTSTRDYTLVKISCLMMVAVFPLSLVSSVGGDRIGFYLYPMQLIVLSRLPLLVRGPYSTAIASTPYAIGALFLLVWTQQSSLFERCYEPYQIWRPNAVD